MKTLVLYFSVNGNTKKVAEELHEILKGDIEEIKPLESYTSADLNWRDKKSRTTLEMTDETSRPSILDSKYYPMDYDYIFIGYPIWWGVEPRCVDTYMDRFGLQGKNVILFATSGGSPISESVKHFKNLYKDVKIKDTLLLNFGIDKDKILSIVK